MEAKIFALELEKMPPKYYMTFAMSYVLFIEFDIHTKIAIISTEGVT